VLEALGVTKEYSSDDVTVTALRGVELTVAAGEFVAVMGPSGCGKSTLLHLLGGLDTPTAGEIVLEGRTLASLSDRELTLVRRHRVGFVFQFFNLVPVLTAAENIALPAVIDGRNGAARDERLTELLQSLRLDAVADKVPSRLSGGEQQRVAIARAMFNRPAVLLADEPTGNLDRRSSEEVMDVFAACHADGQTIVLVTHDPIVAARASRVVFLRDGRLVGEMVPDGTGSLVHKLAELEA